MNVNVIVKIARHRVFIILV